MYKVQTANFLPVSSGDCCTHLAYPQVCFSVGEFMRLPYRRNNGTLGKKLEDKLHKIDWVWGIL